MDFSGCSIPRKISLLHWYQYQFSTTFFRDKTFNDRIYVKHIEINNLANEIGRIEKSEYDVMNYRKINIKSVYI